MSVKDREPERAQSRYKTTAEGTQIRYAPGRFVIDLDRSRLEKAPGYMASNMPNWSDRTYGSRIDEFYGVPPIDPLS
jgi:hypothetical protein